MKLLFGILALLANALVLTSCETANDRIRKKVVAVVDSVTPKAILEGVDELDRKYPDEKREIIPLDALPESFSAFEPFEVQYPSRLT